MPESLPALPPMVSRYLEAYNSYDVPGMVACLSEDVIFKNVAAGEVNLETQGRAAFQQLAEQALGLFSARQQTPVTALTVWDTTVVSIAYRATVAQDLPNGWQAGQEVRLHGASLFKLREGLITELVDQS